jgi:hypothetical protein
MDFHALIKLKPDRQVQGYYEELQSLHLDTKFAGKFAGRREVVHTACGLTLYEARPRADRSWILAQVGARAPLLQAAAGAPLLFLFTRRLVLRHELLLRLRRHLSIMAELERVGTLSAGERAQPVLEVG